MAETSSSATATATPPPPSSSAPASQSSSEKEAPEKAAPQTPPRIDPAERENLLGRTVGEIVIRGLKRIEKEAVLAKIGTQKNSALSADQVRADIQALFGMGYFDDIAVEGEPLGPHQVRVIYVVKERPVISKIEFVGNERLSSSDLMDVIKVKEWSILDVNKVKEDVGLLQKHYEEKGFFLAKISYEVKRLKEDQVELIYRINDYDKIQIKKITFLNNRRFSDQQLKAQLVDTKEGNFLSFVTGSGNFKEAAFKQDLQRLTYWYLDHGYVKFKYESPVVTISEDKKWLFISIYVDEGEQYKIGKTDFEGDLLFSKDELHHELTLKSNDTFAISKRNADIQRLTEKYQDLGYAFTNVIPKMAIHDESRSMDIVYHFEKGNLVHFGEINVVGNAKTFDKVIRRELKIKEGELYSGTKMRESRENVERLGYFAPGEVLFNTITPKGKPDILNVEISVKERSTGTVTLGAGYGSIQGFFFTAQISEINLFGRGQTLSLAAQYSVQRISQSFNLGFTEPYTFDSVYSTGFDLYHVKFPIPYRWTTQKNGFDLRVGRPISEFTRVFLTYKFEGVQDIDVNPYTGIPPSTIAADSGTISSAILSLVRDKRNNRFETTGGNYQSVTAELAGVGGEKDFIKWILNNRLYFRLVGDLVFRNNIEIGQIEGYNNKPVPPSQKFYLGGPNNMKGFNLFLLGPQYTAPNGQPQPTGGSYEAFSLFELEYPIIREAGIKIVVFFDVGNAWDHIPNGTLSDPFIIRTDYGFGLRWFSPIGPLRFEWGFPIARRANEDSPVFQFFVGPSF